jgi:hypothetical protein
MHLSITELGAVPDGQTLCTDAIHAAIRRVHAAGGGVVEVPPGPWLSGMIHLRDGVELHLCHGARLIASPRPEDHHPLIHSSGCGDHGDKNEESFHLIVAQNCRDIAITGPGSLDGNGTAFYSPVEPGSAWPLATHSDSRRMGALVLISHCHNVLLRDVQLGNVCNWTLHLHESDQVRVRDIRIQNPPQAPNSDGIDISGCRGVSLSGCHIDTGDDAICLKTLADGRSCEDIVVTHCILRTHCAALKLGAGESFQDIRNVSFSHCVVRDSHRAIALYSLEGALLENILVSDIVFDTRAALMFPRPIHVDIRRKTPQSRLGGLRGLRICGCIGDTNGRCLFTVEPGARCEDIQLRDLLFRYPCFDDPAPCAADSGGSQFFNKSPRARVERAAFVFENIQQVSMDNIQLRWPESDTPPPEWTFRSKLANGTHRLFTPPDWTLPPGTPVHAVSSNLPIDEPRNSPDLCGWNGGERLHLRGDVSG